MNHSTLAGRLVFLREAERLKSVLRSGFTSTGRAESTAEHSWRLALMALVFADQLPGLDIGRVLKLCVVHDLGEAIHGDIPAIHQHAHPGKSAQERADLHTLTRTLDPAMRVEIVALWDEYEAAATPEAQAVKAFDKLETILQHNQGDNPPDFDYAFNLGYGRKHTATAPLFEALREMLDAETSLRAQAPPGK
jgi:putative hydrolase of HD superfamily